MNIGLTSWLRPPLGVLWSSSPPSLLPLEQCQHQPMDIWRFLNLRRPSPYIPIALWWHSGTPGEITSEVCKCLCFHCKTDVKSFPTVYRHVIYCWKALELIFSMVRGMQTCHCVLTPGVPDIAQMAQGLQIKWNWASRTPMVAFIASLMGSFQLHITIVLYFFYFSN